MTAGQSTTSPAVTAPGRPVRRRPLAPLARLVLGEAGAGVAGVLATAALLVAFLATAAPRELTSASTTALNQALATAGPQAAGVNVAAQWLAQGREPSHLMTPALMTEVTETVAGQMRAPLQTTTGSSWGSFAASVETITSPPRGAVIDLSPELEVAYHTSLTRHGRLLTGSWPDRARTVSPAAGHAGGHARTLLQIAVSRTVASALHLRLGSKLALSGPLRLVVSGIYVPRDPASSYWSSDPLQVAPEQDGGNGTTHWLAGAVIGPGEVTAIQQVLTGQFVSGTWHLGVSSRSLTPATLPALLSALARLTNTELPQQIGAFEFEADPQATSGLRAALSSFEAQQDAAYRIDLLLETGLLAAALVLLLICVSLAVGAWDGELTMLRVRGGSTRQAAGRALGRAALLTVPGALIGTALAVVALPTAGASSPLVPLAVVIVVGAGAPPALTAWRYRRARVQVRGARDEVAGPGQGRIRRLVAEVTVIVLAAGALAVIRIRSGAGQSDDYTSAAPVLAALAASLLAARLYPVPVRGLLRVAAARRGPVGFVGLARAARAGQAATVAPALALVLVLTMAAFTVMVARSVTGGQVAASWRRAGADAAVHARGSAVITEKDRRAVASAPGITHAAAVYTSDATGPLAAQLRAGGFRHAAGVAVVNPASYAALAAATPWPVFPARLLERAPGHRAGPVPVLVSADEAVALGLHPSELAARPRAATLELDGILLRISVTAVIGATPAVPGGGRFVLLPDWAEGRLPSISGADVLLVTGPGTGTTQFHRIVAASVPGSSVLLRQQVLTALEQAPVCAAAEQVSVLAIWAAAGLIAIALLLGLASSAPGRARLAWRMSALGMSTRQSWALALTETVPLLAVGILGMVVAALVLALLIGPALGLALFAGGTGNVPVTPDTIALLLPAAGAVVVAVVIVGVSRALALRRDAAAAAVDEEAG